MARNSHSSRVHPDIPNKPGKTNWVEEAGGLPKYIERIARHLKSDQGFSTSRAIATAVNTVKRWARGGPAAEGGEGSVSAATQAKAVKALAEWERKKRSANMTATNGSRTIDLRDVSVEERTRLAKQGKALPNKSYPIANMGDLMNAITAYGRAPESNRGKVKALLMKRAKALGASEEVLERIRRLGRTTKTESTADVVGRLVELANAEASIRDYHRARVVRPKV